MNYRNFPLGLRGAAALAAAALLAGAVPAAASNGNAKGETAAAAAQKAESAPRERVYCTTLTVTGTILPQRICKTKKQWEEMGARVEPK